MFINRFVYDAFPFKTMKNGIRMPISTVGGQAVLTQRFVNECKKPIELISEFRQLFTLPGE